MANTSRFPCHAAVVGDVDADARSGWHGTKDALDVDAVDGSRNGNRLTDDELRGLARGANIIVRPVAVGVNLTKALAAVIGPGPVAGEHDLVIVCIDHAVVATTGHQAFALAGEKAVGHGEVVVDALVVRVHVVDVVHDVGHADGQTRTVVVVIRGGRHEPGTGDDRWRGRIDFLQVVVLSRGIVHTDVHLTGVVVKVNARDVIGIIVIVG